MPGRAKTMLALALLLGCGERDRLVFEDNDPGTDDFTGPSVTIDQPGADTVLTEGDPFILTGVVADSAGVDTVYFELEAADHNVLPLNGNGADTVRFGLPLSTQGLRGRTLLVQVFGVDVLGNRGNREQRQLEIR